ncbi:hypothetical protein MKX03_009092 [Papaver bracteatum]|nr:hypothetical protein MKX03_009092 [Papaver bracteatum]
MKDPVNGCVSHIFALQQQVVRLQEQITTTRAQQAAQGFVDGVNISTSTNDHIHLHDNHNKLFYRDFPATYPQDIEAINMHLNESKILSEQLYQNNTSMNDSNSTATTDDENMFSYENGVVNMENSPSNQMKMASEYLDDMQMNARKWTFQGTNHVDLQSMAFAYFQHS